MVDTTNLGITLVDANQDQKEVTLNQSTQDLEDAITEVHSVLVDDSDAATITQDDTRQHLLFTLDDDSPAPTGAITITFTAFERGLIAVQNNTSFAATLERASQSTPPVLPAGELRIYLIDGTDILEAGGGSSALAVEDEGSGLGSFTTMNFVGAGVTSVDAGGGEVTVTIPGGGSGSGGVNIAKIGALIRLTGNETISAATDTQIPWDATIYDDTFDPQDGGPVQRLWLGVDKSFVDGDVTVGADTVAETAHGFVDGEGPVRLSSSGTLPAGLATSTDYWMIAVDNDTLAFATSRANALVDTRVDITAAAGGGTHTINTSTKFVVPAGVTKVNLTFNARVSNDDFHFLLKKNFVEFNGEFFVHSSLNTSGVQVANGSSFDLVVSEGDVFELETRSVPGGTVSTDSETWFGMAIEEAADVPADTSASFRNLIVNGDFRISQRGEGVAIVSADDLTGEPYGPDRFFAGEEAGPESRYDVEHVATGGPDGFPNFFRLDVTTAETAVAAGEATFISTRLEAQNLQHLEFGDTGARKLALQFYMQSPKTGTHCVALVQPDGTRSIVTEFEVAVADAWELHRVIFDGDPSGTINDDTGAGLQIVWPVIAGADFQVAADAWAAGIDYATSNQQNLADNAANNIDLTGAQLEVISENATVGSAFEHRPITIELELCQRYYERLDYDSVSLESITNGATVSATQGRANLNFREKRITPAVTSTAAGTFSWMEGDITTQALGTIGFSRIGRRGVDIEAGLTGAATGGGQLRRDATDTTFIEIDAEL